MTTPKVTVAIVGGGIAGLVTAISICHFNQHKDIKIDIYEGAHAFTEIGAGVGVCRRPWEALKNLGLEEELSKISEVKTFSDEPRVFIQCPSDNPVITERLNKNMHFLSGNPINPRACTITI